MTVSVFPPHPENGFTEYQARVGEHWVQGKSLSSAIANAVEAVEADGGEIQALKVIVQKLGGDEFFSDAQLNRRKELTAKMHECRSRGAELSPDEDRELDELIGTELEASGKRAQKLSEVLK